MAIIAPRQSVEESRCDSEVDVDVSTSKVIVRAHS